MKTPQFFFILVFLSSLSFLNAQQVTQFTYDASGNRILRNTIILSPALAPPPVFAEEDSLGFFSNLESILNAPDSADLSERFYSDRLNESDVFIFPNPTRGALAVEIRNKDPKIPHHLAVYNLRGSAVVQQSNIPNYIQIDLSSQPKGMYILRITSQNTFITWKIIKE